MPLENDGEIRDLLSMCSAPVIADTDDEMRVLAALTGYRAIQWKLWRQQGAWRGSLHPDYLDVMDCGGGVSYGIDRKGRRVWQIFFSTFRDAAIPGRDPWYRRETNRNRCIPSQMIAPLYEAILFQQMEDKNVTA